MVFDFFIGWTGQSYLHWAVYMVVLIPVAAAILLLIYTIFEPLISRYYLKEILSPHKMAKEIHIKSPEPFSKIGICVDFSESDTKAINYAMKFGGPETEFILIHIVESAGARVLNREIYDNETQRDKDALKSYAAQLSKNNVNVADYIGFGLAVDVLPEVVEDLGLEMLVLSSHRKGILHRIFKGTTINKVQMKVNIPVFIVK